VALVQQQAMALVILVQIPSSILLILRKRLLRRAVAAAVLTLIRPLQVVLAAAVALTAVAIMAVLHLIKQQILDRIRVLGLVILAEMVQLKVLAVEARVVVLAVHLQVKIILPFLVLVMVRAVGFLVVAVVDQ
jgi:hypothetical protein